MHRRCFAVLLAALVVILCVGCAGQPDPKNGQWPLDEPDPQLVEKINTGNVIWNQDSAPGERQLTGGVICGRVIYFM